jgi:hypothetical protein
MLDNQSQQRYFFEISQNGLRADRTDGLTFPDKVAAWEEASVSCCEIIREMKGKIEPGLDWRMEVTDESGQAIYRLRFTAEAVV